MTTIFYLQKELIILHHRVNVTFFTGKIQLLQVHNKNEYSFGEFSSDPTVLAFCFKMMTAFSYIIFLTIW